MVIDALTIMYSIVIFPASANNIPFVSAFKFKDVTGGITDVEGQRETEEKEMVLNIMSGHLTVPLFDVTLVLNLQ